ncbi:MAG: hypothetical protein DRQ01_08425 [Ignavibacteriae bacterium]|nr:MAG: hypothetical protein DRQ01_08425 [Ignavibacteriota bacterium]
MQKNNNNRRDIKMKTSHIFWGTLFIVLGLLVLINNFTTIFMDWGTIWKLWPAAIVLLGISLLIKHKLGKGVVAGVAALIIAVSVFATFKTTAHFIHDDFSIVFDELDDREFEVTKYEEAMDSSITKAFLEFDAGAGSFNVKDTTHQLIIMKTEGVKDNYKLKRFDSDSSSKIQFSMKHTRFRIGGKNYKNKVDISLNSKPVWDMEFDIGAASVKLDLTPYKINDLNIDMGAAALDVRLGDLNDETNVDIEAGASDIDLFVPEGSGCQIKTDIALSSKNFHGFEKIKKNFYQTSNFEDAEKKIYIEIDCGVSSISVRRY